MSKDKDLTPEARVGTVVRDWRKFNELTQEELASAVGSLTGTPMHKTAISKIEAGQRPLSFAEAVAISTMLTVPLKDLAHPLQPVSVFQKWDRTIKTYGEMSSTLDELHGDARLVIKDLEALLEIVESDHSIRGTIAKRREGLKKLLPDMIKNTRDSLDAVGDIQALFATYASANDLTGFDPEELTDSALSNWSDKTYPEDPVDGTA